MRKGNPNIEPVEFPLLKKSKVDWGQPPPKAKSRAAPPHKPVYSQPPVVVCKHGIDVNVQVDFLTEVTSRFIIELAISKQAGLPAAQSVFMHFKLCQPMFMESIEHVLFHEETAL